MSFEVDTALVQTYKSNIEIQFQQKGSRLRSTVNNVSQKAEFDFYDRIGPTDAVEVTTRHSDTPLISTPHDRRRIALRDFDWADMIDRKDKIRMLADPTSPYTMNAVYALGRKMDDVIVSAAVGTAYTGKTGSSTVAHPAASKVAKDYVESGSAADSNLTIAKLRRVRYLLTSTEAVSEEDEEGIHAIITANQIQALLRTTEVTSADYNTVKALVEGKIDTFMGFKFKRTERLAKSGNIRNCLFYPASAINLAIGEDIVVDVGPRRDKRNAVQIYVCATFGASRMWEEKVIEVACDETK
jgi:hypothetical protein